MSENNKYSEIIDTQEFTTLVPMTEYQKVFTKTEILNYSERKNLGSMAARYIIKKYVVQFYPELKMTDIEILNDSNGKPVLNFLKQKNDNKQFFISLSHSKTHAAAIISFEIYDK